MLADCGDRINFQSSMGGISAMRHIKRAVSAATSASTHTCYPNTPAAFSLSDSDVVNKQVTRRVRT